MAPTSAMSSTPLPSVQRKSKVSYRFPDPWTQETEDKFRGVDGRNVVDEEALYQPTDDLRPPKYTEEDKIRLSKKIDEDNRKLRERVEKEERERGWMLRRSTPVGG